MTKKEAKELAQEKILHYITGAFYSISDDPQMNEKDKSQMFEALDKQMRRIEKLFGFVPGSWGRG